MDQKTDGDRLSELLGDRNRAEFARQHKLRGGGSLISQHVSGHRPISLEAARAYAQALGVPLEAVSPDRARLVRDASAVLSTSHVATQPVRATLAEALATLGIELARDMPDDVREDVADTLAKLAHRRGAERHQAELITLLNTPPPDKRDLAA